MNKFFQFILYLFVFVTTSSLILILFGYMDFPSSERPDLIVKAAGCYALDDDRKVLITLNKNGNLISNNFSVNFNIDEAKGYYLIVPDENIAYNIISNKVENSYLKPKFIRYDDDHLHGFELEVYGENSVVHFSKIGIDSCL